MGTLVVMDSIGGSDGKEFMGIVGKYHFSPGIDHGGGIALVDNGDPIVKIGEPVRIDIDHIRRDLASLDMACPARGYWKAIIRSIPFGSVHLYGNLLLVLVLFLEKVPNTFYGSLYLLHGFLQGGVVIFTGHLAVGMKAEHKQYTNWKYTEIFHGSSGL